jgi:hypothetical protein
MREFTHALLAVALLAPVPLLAQQQHSTQTSPTPSDPTKNNPDVPSQAPNTDKNPDLAPQNQPAPGGTSSTSSGTAKQAKGNKHHRKSSKSTSNTGTQF